MILDINKNEAWKMLDALVSYKKDYALATPVVKIIDTVTKKLKGLISEN